MRKFVILAVASICFVGSAIAAEPEVPNAPVAVPEGPHKADPKESGLKEVPAAAAPAPKDLVSAPAAGACQRVTLLFSNITEPGKGWITIQTDPSKVSGEGLLEALQQCNGASNALSQAGSKNSVDVLSVFSAQGETTIKVPAKWKPVLRARFHSPDKRFDGKGFWQSQPFGEQAEIAMSVVTQGDGKIVENRKF